VRTAPHASDNDGVTQSIVRRGAVLACVATSLVAVAAAGATTPAGYGSASCLRGEWRAGQAETARVVRALAPVPGMQVRSSLYMIFRDNAFQYGTTSIILTMSLGDATLTAKARFFTLAPYGVPRPGVLRLSRGSSTIEYGEFSGTKDGRTYTVPGPAPRTRRVPAGTVPFQCRRGTLRVKLPSFAALDWITLRRASS
jgi:hypothetical protein